MPTYTIKDARVKKSLDSLWINVGVLKCHQIMFRYVLPTTTTFLPKMYF